MTFLARGFLHFVLTMAKRLPYVKPTGTTHTTQESMQDVMATHAKRGTFHKKGKKGR